MKSEFSTRESSGSHRDDAETETDGGTSLEQLRERMPSPRQRGQALHADVDETSVDEVRLRAPTVALLDLGLGKVFICPTSFAPLDPFSPERKL